MGKLRFKSHNGRRLCSSAELECAHTEKLLERDKTGTLGSSEVGLADTILLIHMSLIYILTILTVFISSDFAYALIIITLLWMPTVVTYLKLHKKTRSAKSEYRRSRSRRTFEEIACILFRRSV